MGTIHHGFAIAVVDACDPDKAADAFADVRDFARKNSETFFNNYFDQLLVGPIESVVNFTQTYFMAPDGSKEWWSTSDIGNKVRQYFIDKMTEAGADVVYGSFGELEDTFVRVERY